MASKYAKVNKKLPRLEAADPDRSERQTQVDALKALVANRNPSALAQAFCDLREEKERLEDALSDVNLRIEAFSQLLIDAYESADVSSLTLDTGDSVRIQYEPTAVIKDKVAFRRWCLEEGLEQSLQLPWMTANAITKERLLAGQPEPEGVQAYVRTQVVRRKGGS